MRELSKAISRGGAKRMATHMLVAVISATSIYLRTLVITNDVYICPMLIDGCSNIWWGGRSAGKNKINI